MRDFDFSEFRDQGFERVGELNAYVTLACDLRCRYCYMFNFLAKAKDKSELMDPAFFLGMTTAFCEQGGGIDRMALLGGEPTLHPQITEICNDMADLPIRDRRITTNGIGLHHLDLAKLKPGVFDHISISVDGVNDETNSATRGTKTFGKIIETIGLYRQAGIPVSINYTVTTRNVDSLNNVVPFFAEHGASMVNFHRASLDGAAYQHQDLIVGAQAWVRARDGLFESLRQNGASYPGMTIRIPYTFLTPQQMQTLGYRPIQEENYHSPQGGHRLIVFPPTEKGKGLCYMSSDVIGQEGAELGHVTKDGVFHWNRSPPNELTAYRNAPSANVSSDLKGQDEGLLGSDLVRVSHSFKEVIKTDALRAPVTAFSASTESSVVTTISTIPTISSTTTSVSSTTSNSQPESVRRAAAPAPHAFQS